MIIDVNTYIGHYPFRKTKYKTAADLISLMDQYGIDKSCVSSLNGIYYKDCMEGNYELLEEIQPYTDRLIPFCVINPDYNGAADDFEKCIRELGFKGLRLFPKQHEYRLDDALSIELLKLSGEMAIPVHIPLQLEDLRGRHPLDIFEPIDSEEIKLAALAAPETDIILSNEFMLHYAREIEPACKKRSGSVYYDIARLDCLYQAGISAVIKETGYERLVFGTGSPLQTIPVQLVKLHYMNVTIGAAPEQIEMIKSGNLAPLLDI